MNITLSTLSQLDAGRSYYLSNTTGTIKRTNLWQWFKCVTGLGDGRAKAQRLADLVKTSILANADLQQDAALSQDIARLDTTYSLSGASLREIAGRFKTAHADAVAAVDARRQAFSLAGEAADENIREWAKNGRVLSTPENLDYIKKIALYSVQHLMSQAQEDRKISDPAGLKGQMGATMRKAIEAIGTAEIMQTAQGSKLGYPMGRENEDGRKLGIARFKFDELHFRAVLACLMTRDGPASLSDFTRRLTILFQENKLQERRAVLMDTKLEPPETPPSGFVFAEKALKTYKVSEDPEWTGKNI